MVERRKKQISVTLREETIRMLDEYAKKIGVSRSEAIELIVQGLIDPPGGKKKIELPIEA
jgi:metal-responsive CopG/Arc/MetJ family transcriptional regulator